jgi:hypothetical protein
MTQSVGFGQEDVQIVNDCDELRQKTKTPTTTEYWGER